MRSRATLVTVLILVAVLAAAGGIWWYVVTPHTAEAQFAVAEKLEKSLRTAALSKDAKELAPQINEVIETYRKVGIRFGFGPQNPKAAEAHKRIALVQEEVEKEPAKAIATLDELQKAYPEEENTGFALMDQARMLRKMGKEISADKKQEAAAKFRDAITKLEEFRKKFETSKDGDAALMEIGRIWMDDLIDPLIRPIEIFKEVISEYPRSKYEPEAKFRLAEQLMKIQEVEQALEVYTELIEEYPKSEYTAPALEARGKILAERQEKHEEAAKDFERLAQDFPDDPRAAGAQQAAREQRQQAAAQEGEEYGEERYGGTIPIDTTDDKALPPAELLKQFTAQKLDAEQYDLNVTFEPKDHRITVNGTLKLTNRGDEKKELLLMLGPGLKISNLTVNGAEANKVHQRDTLKIVLPAPLAKDAPAEIAFAYSGQYQEPEAMEMLRPGPAGGTKGARPEKKPATAPATAPSTTPSTKPAADEPEIAEGSNYQFDPQMGLGEYGYGLSGASWYPITIIGDVFDAHVTIRTPANYEAVTNGELLKREKSTREGVQGVFEFTTRNPVFGLYFAYGPFTVQETRVGSIRFFTYFRPQHAPKHDAYVQVANRILSFYASKFDGFPYEKMAIIDTPLPPFLGGVGPASLMFLQQSMVDHAEVPENLLAHELAHQWFGNLIPINITDANYNQWLSEGFATYSDALYTEHKEGTKAFHLHITKYEQLFFQFAQQAPRGSGAIRDTVSMGSSLYRPVVYEKGAVVLHMLRKVMGDEKFFRLMVVYIQTYKNKPSTTDDFRRLASEIHGSDLSWFFGQWYDRAVFAHWKIVADVKTDTGGGSTTKVTITQPNDLVVMPADITFLGAAGERVVMKDVMLDKKENVLEHKTPFAPVKIIIDEDNWVLKRLGGDNIWTSAAQPPAK